MNQAEPGALSTWQQARRGRADVVSDLEAGVAAGGHSRLHGTLGRLAYQDDGSGVQCHLCGLFYRNLGQHVRRQHQIDPDDYRELVGLNRHTSLAAPVLQAHLADRAHRLETHTRLTPRAGRGGAPMPPTRLEGRLREAQQARAQETVAVACPRCGGPVLVPRRRAHLATYCPTCRPLRKRETERQWERQRRSSRHGASQVRVACARSGTAIIVLPVRASRTNYCPTCRQVRKRETGRLANRRYRERHRG